MAAVRWKTGKAGNPTEDQEQISLVEWIDRCIPFVPLLENFTAVPNGGMRPQKVNPKTGAVFSFEAQKLRRMGLRPGYPDVLLDVPVGVKHGLRIELKSLAKTARPSTDQLGWRSRLLAEGYDARVCRGWIAAAWAIAEYLRPRVGDGVFYQMARLIPAS